MLSLPTSRSTRSCCLLALSCRRSYDCSSFPHKRHECCCTCNPAPSRLKGLHTAASQWSVNCSAHAAVIRLAGCRRLTVRFLLPAQASLMHLPDDIINNIALCLHDCKALRASWCRGRSAANRAVTRIKVRRTICVLFAFADAL